MLGGLGRARGLLPAFAAGFAAGIAAAWVLARGAAETQPRARLEDHVGGEAGLSRWAAALLGARERVMGDADPVIDLDVLRRRLVDLPGSERVHLRDLGGGIVEALGSAPDSESAQHVLEALRGADGVEVVVNRIWTPASAARAADLSRGPGPSDL